MRRQTALFLFVMLFGFAACGAAGQPLPPTTPAADNPAPPSAPVKLIFVHHSTGGNWLADPNQDGPYGGLAQALMANNYFVSATNYEWGPQWDDGGGPIGNFTDIIHWPAWFTGPQSSTFLEALYHEFEENVASPGGDNNFGAWARLNDPDPQRENEIILFKSCFPNSNLYGAPTDDAYATPNDWEYSVANAKAVYNDLLTYFATRQDKLFVVITAPPLAEGEYVLYDGETPAADRAANARAFNNWLVGEWLASYPHNNVAVFDYYDVLTSNGSAARTDDTSTSDEPNDLDMDGGNHHRWNADPGAVEHTIDVANDYAAYPSYSGGPDYFDSHPTTAGHQKATAEFVPLLNVFYNRWRGAAPPTVTYQIHLPGVLNQVLTGAAQGLALMPSPAPQPAPPSSAVPPAWQVRQTSACAGQQMMR